MARSVITLAEPLLNAVATVTKDALDATNNHSLDVSDISGEQLQIFIEMDSTVSHVFSVKEGDFEDGAKGDLDITLAAVGTTVLTIETARFKDYDGLILIDLVSTGASGTIYAAAIPVGA
jgi:glutamate mutase epsilon subunit